MALSGLKQSINENGTGATTPTSDGVACFIGYSTLGTAETWWVHRCCAVLHTQDGSRHISYGLDAKYRRSIC